MIENVCNMLRVGQNRIHTPYMNVYLVISLSKITYTYTVYDRIFGDFPAKNTVFSPYMTVYLVISLPKIPYIHRIYTVWASPTYAANMCLYTNACHFSAMTPPQFATISCTIVGLARTVYIHCMWPYVWWLTWWKHRRYTVCMYGFGQPYTGAKHSRTLPQIDWAVPSCCCNPYQILLIISFPLIPFYTAFFWPKS